MVFYACYKLQEPHPKRDLKLKAESVSAELNLCCVTDNSHKGDLGKSGEVSNPKVTQKQRPFKFQAPLESF